MTTVIDTVNSLLIELGYNEMTSYIKVSLFPLEPVLHGYCSLYNKIRLFRKKIQSLDFDREGVECSTNEIFS